MTDRNAPNNPACRSLLTDAAGCAATCGGFLTGDPQLGQYSAPSGSKNPHLSQFVIRITNIDLGMLHLLNNDLVL